MSDRESTLRFFASVGIEIEFVRQKPAYPHVHGVLTGFWVDWPTVDFRSHFSSNSAATFPLFGFDHPKLDRAMESYAASLSEESPDFKQLQVIHEILYEIEPFTLLMQHEACLDVDDRYNKRVKNINSLDPDWFRMLMR